MNSEGMCRGPGGSSLVDFLVYTLWRSKHATGCRGYHGRIVSAVTARLIGAEVGSPNVAKAERPT